MENLEKDKIVEIDHLEGVKELKEKIRHLYKTPSDERLDKIQKKIIDFKQILLSAYGKDECEKHAMYHAFFGSSTSVPIEKIDFPDNNSVVRFIDSLVIEEKCLDLQERLEDLYKKHGQSIMDEVARFTKKLVEDKFESRTEPNKTNNVKELYEYALYHLLEREDPDKPWSKFSPEKIDFPEHSIEKFIEELEEKYKDK